MTKANNNVNIEDLDDDFVEVLSLIEGELGSELIVTSGYRPVDHPVEKGKSKAGEHTYGRAVDVAAIGGTTVFMIVQAAIKCGITRIGISRKSNFIHLGGGYPGAVAKTIWTY